MTKHSLTDEIKPGDYVHAAAWSDFDPNDPWCIGFVHHITIDKTIFGDRVRYFICDEDGELLEGGRGYKHAKHITPEEGAAFLEATND